MLTLAVQQVPALQCSMSANYPESTYSHHTRTYLKVVLQSHQWRIVANPDIQKRRTCAPFHWNGPVSDCWKFYSRYNSNYSDQVNKTYCSLPRRIYIEFEVSFPRVQTRPDEARVSNFNSDTLFYYPPNSLIPNWSS